MLSLSNASRLAEALSEAEGEVEGTQNAITRPPAMPHLILSAPVNVNG
jgi:hypothetical protein